MSRKPKLPVYYTVAQIREILNAGDPDEWSYKRVRAWLMREGAIVKRAGRLVTTRARLRDAFPEIWDDIVEHVYDPD